MVAQTNPDISLKRKTRLIAHRGLISGPDKSLENKVKTIDKAITLGYDVELDVWFKDQSFFLGHDRPLDKIPDSFLINRRQNLWIHAKNPEALQALVELSIDYPDINFFWHENDQYTLTSLGVPWIYPSIKIIRSGIVVMPETFMDLRDIKNFKYSGICSDYIHQLRKIIE